MCTVLRAEHCAALLTASQRTFPVPPVWLSSPSLLSTVCLICLSDVFLHLNACAHSSAIYDAEKEAMSELLVSLGSIQPADSATTNHCGVTGVCMYCVLCGTYRLIAEWLSAAD